MVNITIIKLIWDEWNVAHIARHHVVPDEVEEVCHGPYLARQTYRKRFLVTGPTQKERILDIVLAPEAEAGTYYVVTALTANHTDQQWYQATLTKGGEQAA